MYIIIINRRTLLLSGNFLNFWIKIHKGLITERWIVEMLVLSLCACLNIQVMMKVNSHWIYNPTFRQNILTSDAVVEYKKVATPSFRFTQNKFPKFDLSILNMPGTQNVPLGDFNIENNKVPCDCSLIKVLTEINKTKCL